MKSIRTFFACCWVVGAALPLMADTLQVGNNTLRDVEVIGLRSGRLYYINKNGREQNAPLEQVRGVALDKYPDLAKANDAFDKGNFKSAAKLLASVVDKAEEEHVLILAGAKLVVSLDRQGMFTEAVDRYAELLAVDPGPLTQAATPTSLPKEPSARDEATKALKETLKKTRDPLAKQFLEKTIASLESGEAPAPDDGSKPRSGLLATADEQGKDEILQLVESGKLHQAMEKIDEGLKKEGVSLPRLLYYRGRALQGLGKENDALLSYMRVVIHYSSSSSGYYGASLIDAGKIFAKQNKPRHARQLWTEALNLYGKSSAESREINKLIDALPKE